VKPIKVAGRFVNEMGSLKLLYVGKPKTLMSCVLSLMDAIAEGSPRRRGGPLGAATSSPDDVGVGRQLGDRGQRKETPQEDDLSANISRSRPRVGSDVRQGLGSAMLGNQDSMPTAMAEWLPSAIGERARVRVSRSGTRRHSRHLGLSTRLARLDMPIRAGLTAGGGCRRVQV
jgi:hypothetical protein